MYYLAGPVAPVLSAEALSGGGASREPGPDAEADAAERAAASAQIGLVRRAYLIVVLLGILALGIPLAGVLAGDLPARSAPRVDRPLRRRRAGSSGSPSPGSLPAKRRRS